MTQEDIIRSPIGREQLVALAREAGFSDHEAFEGFECLPHELERFAALVAAHEREQCAKVCEDGINNATDWDSSYWDQCCENRAAAIRARGMDLLTQHSQAIGEYNDYS